MRVARLPGNGTILRNCRPEATSISLSSVSEFTSGPLGATFFPIQT